MVLPASAAPSARALSYLAEAQSWVVRADASPPAAATTEPTARPVLLLAEDNADMAAYLTRVLAQHWQVHHHRDGREALEALRAGAYRGAESSLPDLVLADVMMPRMDGVELVRAIRRDLGLTQLPVVLLTARAGQDAALQGLAAGADDYLTKPFTSLDLLTRLHTPPARRRSQRHLLLPAPGDHRRSTSSRSRGARPETRPHRAAHGGRPAGGAPRRRRLLHRRGLARDDVDGLVLAVGEVASNAVEHRDPHVDAASDSDQDVDAMTIALSLDDHQAVVQLTAAGLYLGRTPPADRGRGAQVIAAETTAQVSSTDGRVTITLRRRVSPGGPSRLPADG